VVEVVDMEEIQTIPVHLEETEEATEEEDEGVVEDMNVIKEEAAGKLIWLILRKWQQMREKSILTYSYWVNMR